MLGERGKGRVRGQPITCQAEPGIEPLGGGWGDFGPQGGPRPISSQGSQLEAGSEKEGEGGPEAEGGEMPNFTGQLGMGVGKEANISEQP